MDPTATPRAPAEAVRGLVGAARILERACGSLTLAQYRVLSAVATGDERASRIAARLAVGKPTISAAVESLSTRGLLARDTVDGDQRAAALRLTEAGAALLAATEQSMRDQLARLAAHTPDPVAVLGALATLEGALESYRDERVATRAATPLGSAPSGPDSQERR